MGSAGNSRFVHNIVHTSQSTGVDLDAISQIRTCRLV
jgi:hypothetical protein